MFKGDVLEVKKRDIDLSEYTKRSAFEGDYETLIRKDTLIKIDGKPAILYMKLNDWDFEPLRNCLMGIKYDSTTRSSGLKTTSRVFGYQPRIPMRRDFCTKTSLAHDTPEKNALVCEYGHQIVPLYRQAFPEIFEEHNAWVEEKVLSEWKINQTPFTSGIINKNNPLKYHFDAGNIKDVCSCMLAMKRSSGGGYLSFPELGLGFEIADKSLTIFDGQSLLHGVTPIRKLSENAHRYTIVYYTLHQMWKCEPLTEEIARIRKVKTQRELRRTSLAGSGELPTEAELHVTQHGVEEGKSEE